MDFKKAFATESIMEASEASPDFHYLSPRDEEKLHKLLQVSPESLSLVLREAQPTHRCVPGNAQPLELLGWVQAGFLEIDKETPLPQLKK